MDKSLDEIISSKSSSRSVDAAGASGSTSSGGVGKGRRSRGSRRGGSSRGGRGGHRSNMRAVCVRNLSPKVTENEFRDLFREVGPVSRTVFDTDDRRKRTGLAWVLYKFAEDAAVAAGRFNGRRAAGQIISVRQVTDIGDVGVSLNDRVGAPSQSRDSSRSKRSGDKKRSGPQRSGPRVPKSQEELDAELDAYMNDDEPAPAPAPSAEPTSAATLEAPAAAPQEDISI